MKINKNLSRYILDEDGSVFLKKDGTPVDQEKGQFKLVTDEKFKSSITGKTSNIVRRFTKEQIVKIWKAEDSDPVEVFEQKQKMPKDNPKIEEAIKDQASKETEEERKKMISGSNVPEYQFEVNGVKYRNAKEASKAIGVSPNTITNRAKKGVEGYKAL